MYKNAEIWNKNSVADAYEFRAAYGLWAIVGTEIHCSAQKNSRFCEGSEHTGRPCAKNKAWCCLTFIFFVQGR
jgi:hypothetical protein